MMESNPDYLLKFSFTYCPNVHTVPLKGKLPEKLWEIRAKHGHSTFRKELINEVNKLGVTKKQLEDGYAYKNGFLVKVKKILKGSLDLIPSPSVK